MARAYRGCVMKGSAVLVLILAVALFTGCGGATTTGPETNGDEQGGSPAAAQAALDDWILGTDLGIESGVIDESVKTVTLKIYGDRYSGLSDQDKADIRTAVADIMLAAFGSSLTSKDYRVRYEVDGELMSEEGLSGGSAGESAEDTSAVGAGGSAVNLVFIHHSVGENWLSDGLCEALNEDGYHVADIYYGWREYGDNTDTIHWPTWFTDKVMGLVYQELGNMTAPNTLAPAPGQNTIVMFKSCYPNSDVGSDISDEKAIYNGLLPYLEQHPDKMFVLVTPSPMREISDPQKTRELCDWLADRESGWLSGLSTGNVFVFDFYNVLTDPAAHHRLVDGKEVHESVPDHNTLAYPSGDDHPNSEGNIKATGEFVPLLDLWYRQFVDSRS
jgi:hypothetical protein